MIGLYGKKLGMTQLFSDDGSVVPVTVLYIEKNVIIGDVNEKKQGYSSRKLAAFKNKTNRFTKSHIGQFPKGVELRKKIFEVDGFADKELGSELGVEVFEDILFVDVTGISKGKGHQGVMKRHGAHGGPAAHGSKFHRTGGSTGHAATPSRVRKGTKMSGRMGTDKTTVQNLKVVSVNKDENILVVRGAIPGSVGSAVYIRNAKKKV